MTAFRAPSLAIIMNVLSKSRINNYSLTPNATSCPSLTRSSDHWWDFQEKLVQPSNKAQRKGQKPTPRAQPRRRQHSWQEDRRAQQEPKDDSIENAFRGMKRRTPNFDRRLSKLETQKKILDNNDQISDDESMCRDNRHEEHLDHDYDDDYCSQEDD